MEDRDTGLVLNPKYDADGLLTAIAVHADTLAPLMVAHMNAEALRRTLETREATFWSRSRARLWKKGETSGNVLRVVEARIDCDQDALVLRCRPLGPTCHTGARSCFYRRLEDGALHRI